MAFNYKITNLPNYQICLPHPPVVNYDSKRLISFNPRNYVLNRSLITSNWPQIASNFIDHRTVLGPWLLRFG